MVSQDKQRATALLAKLNEGQPDRLADPRASELTPLVYDELRRLAEGYLRTERSGHTLQPTALVHEAYLRLIDQTRVDWKGRTHFLAVGAQMMRRLLIDHGRRRARVKRGGGWLQREFDEAFHSPGSAVAVDDLFALNRALEKLKSLDQRQEQVVELRFFAGLKVSEVADLLGISTRTVEGDWAHARAWLKRELCRPEADTEGST